eukprot:TRINITY_DN27687_c0_g1_i1.p1 TRINITY_DN27687_c0_g1~~TRINITY_DN27687_c0_g1_i1.p1  ORF type:complete len:114 (-),score=14.77 TRINITY_DN27687_c0_g1_i1:337-678(-)
MPTWLQLTTTVRCRLLPGTPRGLEAQRHCWSSMRAATCGLWRGTIKRASTWCGGQLLEIVEPARGKEQEVFVKALDDDSGSFVALRHAHARIFVDELIQHRGEQLRSFQRLSK